MAEQEISTDTSPAIKLGQILRKRPMSRRQFGKAAIAIVGTLGLGSEIKKGIEPRIETEQAVFHPYYEEHWQSVALTALPSNLDIHWYEGGKDVIELIIEDQLRDKFPDNRGKQNIFFLKSRNATLVSGDIDVPKYSDWLFKNLTSALRPPSFETENPLMSNVDSVYQTAVVYLVGRVGGRFIQEIMNKIRKKQSEKLKEKLSRREFFKKSAKMLLIAADMAATYLTLNSLVGFGWDKLIEGNGAEVAPLERKAAERVINRLYGILSHAKPFDLIIFCRNIFWAHKMLDLADQESRSRDRKVNISYQVGAAHSGVEDFLILGKGFCETVIRSYPKQLLEALVSVNGGLEAISETGRYFPNSREEFDSKNAWEKGPSIYDRGLQNLLAEKTKN